MIERLEKPSPAAQPFTSPVESAGFPFNASVFAIVYALLFLASTAWLASGYLPTASLEAVAVVAAASIGAFAGASAGRGARSGLGPALVAGLVAALTVAIVAHSFKSAGFDPVSAPFWPALAAALSAPIARENGDGRRSALRADALAVVTIAGILLSAALCEYPWWWQRSISYLGHGEALHRWVFDATLVACAALCFKRSVEVRGHLSVLESLGVVDPVRRRLTAGVYRVAAASLLLVIVFPYGNGRSTPWAWIHNIGAWIAFGVLLLAMVAAPRLTPFLPKGLLRESIVLFGVVAFLFVLYWPVRYLSLALFEVMSLVVILAWLARWTHSLASAARAHEPARHAAAP